jgi:hypothetical protein
VNASVDHAHTRCHAHAEELVVETVVIVHVAVA